MARSAADDLKGEVQLAALVRSIRALIRELKRERRKMRELHDDDDEEDW